MKQESATMTYRVPQPFEAVVRTLRQTLAEAGLNITRELNVTERIRQILSVGMSPCLILFASFPDLAPGAGSGVAPFQIVISDCGPESEVHILRVLLAA
jgi:uncharacterized protein (DUF302 family)